MTVPKTDLGLLGNKVAFVTGGGNGIGRACAMALAREGAAVMVTDVDLASAERTAVSIRRAGGRAAHHKVDVGIESEVASGIDATIAAFGGLNIMHNNAADTSMPTMGRDVDVVGMDPDLWDHVFAVGLRGTMLCCKYGIPAMLAGGGGSIVNTSSLGGSSGMDFLSAYCAMKAAVNQLTRSVATQYGKSGVRCNAVAPGMVITDAADMFTPEKLAATLSETLTPYLGDPEDVAALVVFLASDAARYITGQIVPVDGGHTAHSHGHGNSRVADEVSTR